MLFRSLTPVSFLFQKKNIRILHVKNKKNGSTRCSKFKKCKCIFYNDLSNHMHCFIEVTLGKKIVGKVDQTHPFVSSDTICMGSTRKL